MLSDGLHLDGSTLEMTKKKLQKLPRKEPRPRKAPTPALKRELTAWDAEFMDCEGEAYVEFKSLDEFKSYMQALGESFEIDPEGMH